MALIIYRGGTKKFSVVLYDKNSVELDCATMENIEVILTHKVTKQEYAKYSMTAQAGWITVSVVDGRLVVPINATITETMDLGALEVMVTVYQTDTDFTNSESIVKAKTVLAYVKDV